MSIRQFETAEVKAPFLGKPHYPISGIDQLRLNLTCERVFDLLSPDLYNVTGRIRYYSFTVGFLIGMLLRLKPHPGVNKTII